MKRKKKDLKERLNLVKLNRSGNTQDITNLIMYLLFKNNFITGEVISIDGGDWI